MQFLTVYPDDPRQIEFKTVFGDLNKLAGSQHDPAVWLKNAAADPAGNASSFYCLRTTG